MMVDKCKVIDTNTGDHVMITVEDRWFGHRMKIRMIGEPDMYTESVRGDYVLLLDLFNSFSLPEAARFAIRMNKKKKQHESRFP